MAKAGQTLIEEIRSCCWLGHKTGCATHMNSCFPLSINDYPLVQELSAQSSNGRKLKEQIISIAAGFVSAMNLICCQAAPPVIYCFIVKLMTLGASLLRGELRRIVNIELLVDALPINQSLTQSIREPKAGSQRQSGDSVMCAL
jgi:hypothetical protein